MARFFSFLSLIIRRANLKCLVLSSKPYVRKENAGYTEPQSVVGQARSRPIMPWPHEQLAY